MSKQSYKMTERIFDTENFNKPRPHINQIQKQENQLPKKQEFHELNKSNNPFKENNNSRVKCHHSVEKKIAISNSAYPRNRHKSEERKRFQKPKKKEIKTNIISQKLNINNYHTSNNFPNHKRTGKTPNKHIKKLNNNTHNMHHTNTNSNFIRKNNCFKEIKTFDNKNKMGNNTLKKNLKKNITDLKPLSGNSNNRFDSKDKHKFIHSSKFNFKTSNIEITKTIDDLELKRKPKKLNKSKYGLGENNNLNKIIKSITTEVKVNNIKKNIRKEKIIDGNKKIKKEEKSKNNQ